MRVKVVQVNENTEFIAALHILIHSFFTNSVGKRRGFLIGERPNCRKCLI